MEDIVTFTDGEIRRLHGATVYDCFEERVGTVGQVWSDASGRPAWVSVNTGLFGMNETLMPLVGAHFTGDQLRSSFPKEIITDAPNVDVNIDHPLDEDSTRRLYAHYTLTGDEDI
jgi:hypothetical protein